MPAPEVEALDRDDFYERLAQQGYGYSGLFRSLRGIGTDPARPEVVYAEVALPAGTDVTGYGIHPALLDAALHPLASVLDRHRRGRPGRRCGFRTRSAGSPCMPPRPPSCISS